MDKTLVMVGRSGPAFERAAELMHEIERAHVELDEMDVPRLDTYGSKLSVPQRIAYARGLLFSARMAGRLLWRAQ